MIPTSRVEFADYCLRKLGDPVININISPEQLDDRIDEALSYFYERHYDGTEIVHMLHEITTDEMAQGYIELPSDIVGVTDIFRLNSSGSGLFSVEFQYQLQELYSSGGVNMFRTGDVTYWYMINSHLSLINKYFSPARSFQYNENSQRLQILGGLNNSSRIDGGYVGIKAFKKVLGEASQNPTIGNTETVGNIWKNRWLQQYASALIRLQWGGNMSKFKDIKLLGGVTLSGSELVSQAREDITFLEQELDSRYRHIPGFIMG